MKFSIIGNVIRVVMPYNYDCSDFLDLKKIYTVGELSSIGRKIGKIIGIKAYFKFDGTSDDEEFYSYTMGKSIYITPIMLHLNLKLNTYLFVHELLHVKGYEKHGEMFRRLLEKYGYDDILFDAEISDFFYKNGFVLIKMK